MLTTSSSNSFQTVCRGTKVWHEWCAAKFYESKIVISSNFLESTRLKMAENVAPGRPNNGTTPVFVESSVVPWLGRPGATFLRRLPYRFPTSNLRIFSNFYRAPQIHLSLFIFFFLYKISNWSSCGTLLTFTTREVSMMVLSHRTNRNKSQ
jgi:hypothetical protein